MGKGKGAVADPVDLIEIDGEFCVPFAEGQRRHYIDLGPFEVERSPWYVAKKILLFIPAMFLFILAIQLMKTGAAAVGPSIQGQFPFANGFSTLGTGWLGAYFVLSGSPVAATAISLFGAGTIDKLQAFTMLSGSRLGASFIVLVTGFLYAMKHKDRPRGDSIGIGIQAMTMTAVTYILPFHWIGRRWHDGGPLQQEALHPLPASSRQRETSPVLPASLRPGECCRDGPLASFRCRALWTRR